MKYFGITHYIHPRLLPLWKRVFCTRDWHAWDEVTSVDEHYLSCDACCVALPIDDTNPDVKKCDVCEKVYTDIFETQEFFAINFVGGFGFVFGDGTRIACNVCQHCMKDRLGAFVTPTMELYP